MFFGFLAGTAHPRLRVRDQVIEVDGPGFHKGQQTELDGRRISPCICHQACALDFCAIHLWQPVPRLGEKLGRGVLHLVPLLPLRYVFDAKISREVDDTHAGFNKRFGFTHCDSVGRREKHYITLGKVGLRRIRVRNRDAPPQARKDLGHRNAGLLARSDRDELRLRVAREDAQQLDPGITGPAHDADFNHHRLRKASLPVYLSRSIESRHARVPRCGNRKQKSRPEGGFPVAISEHQRLEYCLRRRALCKPTFFRSTSRASRVTRPALLKSGLSAGSYSIRARVRPWRTAPAWPNSPPPDTFTMTSNWVSLSVSTRGWRTTICPVSRAKYSFAGRSFTMKSPLPALMNTRATELLRRPVP